MLGLVVLAFAAGFLLERGRPALVRSRVRSRFVVTLKTGEAFDGVLYAADSQAWVLRGVQALGAGEAGSTVPVDGELVILVDDIAFAQRP